ncbi:MAG: hypothetical protein KY469_14750 [Actinobacteria bacterium]|nr:hypothetical protein [Actinomycetota bacterium]
MRRGPRNAVVAAVTPGAIIPVVVALVMGLQVPSQRVLPDLPPAADADYSSRFATGFDTLSEDYLRQILGPDPAAVASSTPDGSLAPGTVARPSATSPPGVDPDPLEELPVGGQRTLTPERTPDDLRAVEPWRSQGASISADGGQVAFASTDTRIAGMDPTPCAAQPPGLTAVSALYWISRGNLSSPPPDPGPCDQVVVYDLRTGETTIASIGQSGELANAPVHNYMLSGDGRVVVFSTAASNVVVGDTNDVTDIFVRDLVAGRTDLVSVSIHGGPIRRPPQDYPEQLGYPARQDVPDVLGSVAAEIASISHDGRYVLFESAADDLVEGDTPQSVDVFVRDRLAGTTERVSVTWTGEPPPREDVRSDNQERVEFRTTVSAVPCMAPNGRYVAFRSRVSTLVPGDLNDGPDLFLRDRVTGRTEIVSVSSSGEQGDGHAWGAFGDSHQPRAASHCVSNDGRYVLFSSNSTNLVEDDTNEQWDIFLRDRATDTTRRVSVKADGTQAESPPADRPRLPFEGDTQDHWVAWNPTLSPDGNFVAFLSQAGLTPDDPGPERNWPTDGYPLLDDGGHPHDVFIFDISRGRLTRVDLRGRPGQLGFEDGELAMSHDVLDAPALSSGASFVAYETRITNPYPLKGSVRVYRWRGL